MKSLGIIGMGAVGRALTLTLARELSAPLERVTVLVRPTGVSAAIADLRAAGAKLADRNDVVTNVGALLATRPDLVVECAGHSALTTFGETILASGTELLVVSSGALTDDALRTQLIAAATAGKTRLRISTGAIGGVDMIAAAKLSGIMSLTYVSRKPPSAWKGSPAEKTVALDSIKKATTFYDGTARDAARDYPKNANVAATLALAGPGLDATRVQLIADPASLGNVHEFALRSAAADVDMRIVGRPSPDNPKTSAATALAVARDVLGRVQPIVIG
jgi:aspartate dehydrogenase